MGRDPVPEEEGPYVGKPDDDELEAEAPLADEDVAASSPFISHI